jgi:hypothetical protein
MGDRQGDEISIALPQFTKVMYLAIRAQDLFRCTRGERDGSRGQTDVLRAENSEATAGKREYFALLCLVANR